MPRNYQPLENPYTAMVAPVNQSRVLIAALRQIGFVLEDQDIRACKGNTMFITFQSGVHGKAFVNALRGQSIMGNWNTHAARASPQEQRDPVAEMRSKNNPVPAVESILPAIEQEYRRHYLALGEQRERSSQQSYPRSFDKVDDAGQDDPDDSEAADGEDGSEQEDHPILERAELHMHENE